MTPHKLDRFENLSLLGRSDLMWVFKARDPREKRTVVLRAMRTDIPGQHAADRLDVFRDNLKAAGSLDSPNIASVYEHREADGYFFAVLEYVEGHNLKSLLERGESCTAADVIDISRQVCSALDHAHSRGVIAHNLKPVNLVLEHDGNIKILDFGFSDTTGKKTTVESLAYMSPEQLRGEPLDARSNFFTWGAILYEIVTGHKPFAGDNEKEVFLAVLDHRPPPPVELDPNIPPGISHVIMKALAKPPGDRYFRGAELLRELENYKDFGRVDDDAPVPFLLQTHKKPLSGADLIAPSGRPRPPMPAPVEPSEAVREQPPARHDNLESTPPRPTPEPLAEPAFAAAPAGLTLESRPQWRSSNPAAPVSTMREEAGEAVPYAATRVPVPPVAEAAAGFPSAAPQVAQRGSIFAAAAEPLPPPQPAAAPLPKAEPAPSKNPGWLGTTHQMQLLLYGMAGVIVFLATVVVTGAIYMRHSHWQERAASPASTPAPVAIAPPTPDPNGPQVRSAALEIDPPVIVRHPPRRAAKPVQLQAAAPVNASGELAIGSAPLGAQVQLDGRSDPSWVTPCVIPGVAQGQHTVVLSKPGYTTVSHAVDVVANSRAVLSLPLPELAALIVVGSTPPGAEVAIDGHSTGRTTPAQFALPRGTHSIAVQKAGFLAASTSTDVPSGQTFRFEPVLKPTGNAAEARAAGKFNKLLGKEPDGMGTLQVRTSPRGAKILLNNHVLDRPSPADFYVEPGNYEVTVSLAGYKTVQRVVTVENGGRVMVDEALPAQP